jgi:hypothetical protein
MENRQNDANQQFQPHEQADLNWAFVALVCFIFIDYFWLLKSG